MSKENKNVDVATKINEDVKPEKKVVENFPFFFFEDDKDKVEKIKSIKLTAEEAELLALAMYYKPEKLEYSIIKDFGGIFNVMKVVDDAQTKVYNSSTIANLVMKYEYKHPNTDFDLCNLPKDEIKEIFDSLPFTDMNISLKDLYELYCKPASKNGGSLTMFKSSRSTDRTLIGAEYVDPRMFNSIIAKFKKLLGSDDLVSKCFILEKVESEDPSYVKQREQYESDVKAYKEHPSLFDRAPRDFERQYEYVARLSAVGKKFVEWYES